MATTSVTLYDVEESLTALLDTAEVVPLAQEECFLMELERSLLAAADKRDHVAHFLAFCEVQQSFASTEITRLQSLKKHYAGIQERLEGYVCYVIERLGKDAKGKFKKLEGNSTMMFAQRCPASVEVMEGATLPLDYQRATVTLPACVWQDVLNAMPELLTTVCKLDADKTALKAALQAGDEVPGAKLVTDKLSLRRR